TKRSRPSASAPTASATEEGAHGAAHPTLGRPRGHGRPRHRRRDRDRPRLRRAARRRRCGRHDLRPHRVEARPGPPTPPGRPGPTLAAAAKRIEAAAAHGGSVRWIAADVTREDDVRAAVARALEPTGRLDGCIANAGGGGGMGPYHVQDVQEFLRVLHLNVLGTMLCIKHTVTHLIEAGGG